ncbi:MAG: hypothetical protein H7338_02255 [Candidatus Sericytochromatia bacterium]|nr:hypothetical protein [Candidatus Sericytochromatia bacterium]
MSQTGERLVLYQDAQGPRHFLDGRPVQVDAELALWTPFGWIRGTYGAIWREGTI